jgi:hypothetical protein
VRLAVETRATEFTNMKASAMRALENEFETLRLSLRIKQPSETTTTTTTTTSQKDKEKEKEKSSGGGGSGGGGGTERTSKPVPSKAVTK